MNDLNTEIPAHRRYRLLKPLPGYPIGYEMKVARGRSAAFLEGGGATMTFTTVFLNMFPGWFEPIVDIQKELDI